jgi:hypothetical protein
MKYLTATLILTAALGSVAAADTRQLEAAAGLSRAEAAGLGLDQIVGLKFNRDSATDDRQSVILTGEPQASRAGQAVDPGGRHAAIAARFFAASSDD